MTDDRQPTLPGLDEPGSGEPSVLEAAVLDTLRQYRDASLLTDRDAGKVALAVELAQIIHDKRRSGRTSTVSNDARLLTEILDGFVGESQSADAALAEAMARWEAETRASERKP